MRKAILLILLCWVAMASSAVQRTSVTSELVITYDAQLRPFEETSVPRRERWRLTIGKECSSFCYIQEEKYRPFSVVSMNVYKRMPDEGSLFFMGSPSCTDELDQLVFHYTEPLPEFDWEMLEGDSVICGYACQKARAVFRGRTWVVWYAMDLPYDDGPWKLRGLPGLILKADDVRGDFAFSAVSIMKGDQTKIPVNFRKGSKITPEKYAEYVRLYADNFLDFVLVVLHSGPGSRGKKSPKAQKACLIEYFDKK